MSQRWTTAPRRSDETAEGQAGCSWLSLGADELNARVLTCHLANAVARLAQARLQARHEEAREHVVLQKGKLLGKNSQNVARWHVPN